MFGRLDSVNAQTEWLRLASVVLTAPGVRMNLSAERVIWRRVRKAWQRQHVALETLNLTSAQPAIPKENLVVSRETPVL